MASMVMRTSSYSVCESPQSYYGSKSPQSYNGSKSPQSYYGSKSPQSYHGSKSPLSYCGNVIPLSPVGPSITSGAVARENTPDKMLENDETVEVTEENASQEWFMELGEDFDRVVIERLTQIMKEVEAGLAVLASYQELRELPQNFSDKGRFERTLTKNGKPANVKDDEFPSKYKEFAKHEPGDVMIDEDNKKISKDGGIGVSRSGKILCAAKIFRPIPCNVTWPNHGTRHAAAVEIALQLKRGAVFVRSERGTLHVLTSHSVRAKGGPKAYTLLHD